MVGSDLFEPEVGDVLGTTLEAAEGDVYVVNPSKEGIRALIDVLPGVDSGQTVRLFVDRRPLKDLLDDFLVAGVVADRVERGRLDVRILEAVPRSSLVVSRDFVVSVVANEGDVAGLSTTREPFVTDTVESYRTQWDVASPYTLRTPPLSTIRETMESEIGSAAVSDFDGMLDALSTARGDGEGLDEVTICLLVAANNRELFYDVSQWGERIGLASKATFSRTKNRLEENGLVRTEKVPVEVGRPRLRLLLAETRFAGGDPREVLQHAQRRLG